MARVSIYKFLVHNKWTTFSPQQVDNFQFTTNGQDFKSLKGTTLIPQSRWLHPKENEKKVHEVHEMDKFLSP